MVGAVSSLACGRRSLLLGVWSTQSALRCVAGAIGSLTCGRICCMVVSWSGRMLGVLIGGIHGRLLGVSAPRRVYASWSTPRRVGSFLDSSACQLVSAGGNWSTPVEDLELTLCWVGLWCVLFCCVVLCCVVLLCVVLFCFVLFCFVLFCFVLFCFVLF